jgi:ribosomal-protein-serine acetyltransferase
MIALPIDQQTSLRLIVREDAAELFSLIEANRLYLREWLTWLDGMTSVTTAESYIASRITLAAENKAFCFLIRSEDRAVGLGHLVDIELADRKASIGYWVGAEHRGRGLAKKATLAIVNYAFSELPLNRLEIRCATGNLASRAIPLALGFSEEGILRDSEWLNDRFVDQVIYSVLSREWSKRTIP